MAKKNQKTIYDGVPAGTNIDGATAKSLILNSAGKTIDLSEYSIKNETEELDAVYTTEQKTGDKAEQEKQAIIEYNKNLVKTGPTLCEDIKLNGNNLLVCLFKHQPYSDSGFYSAIQTKQQTPGGKVVSVRAPLQYIIQGVITNMSGSYSDHFKENFKVGDVVTLRMGINLDQLMFFPDIPNLYTNKGGNVYGDFEGIFKINENLIENGFKSR